jgi:hypothetical protein
MMIFYLMTANTHPSLCQTEPTLSNEAIAALAGGIVVLALSFVIAIYSMQEKGKEKK